MTSSSDSAFHQIIHKQIYMFEGVATLDKMVREGLFEEVANGEALMR